MNKTENIIKISCSRVQRCGESREKNNDVKSVWRISSIFLFMPLAINMFFSNNLPSKLRGERSEINLV